MGPRSDTDLVGQRASNGRAVTLGMTLGNSRGKGRILIEHIMGTRKRAGLVGRLCLRIAAICHTTRDGGPCPDRAGEPQQDTGLIPIGFISVARHAYQFRTTYSGLRQVGGGNRAVGKAVGGVTSEDVNCWRRVSVNISGYRGSYVVRV